MIRQVGPPGTGDPGAAAAAGTTALDLPIGSGSVYLLTELGGERGLCPADCLSGTGISEQLLNDPLAEITVRQEYMAMRNLLRHCGDESGLGVEAGLRYHLAMHDRWGLLMASGRDLGDAVSVALRYLDLGWAFTTMTVKEVGGRAEIAIDDQPIPADVRPFLIERVSAAVTVLVGEMLGSDIPQLEVRFRHAEPSDIGRYREAFGTAPTFGAQDNIISFDAELLKRPLPQGHPRLHVGYEKSCRTLLNKRRIRTGLAGAVREILVHQPGLIPDVDEVALALRSSSRTLARRLQDEGTSYRKLVDEVRVMLAEELLYNTELSCEQVARRLGYAEPASFVRAFKRWKGTTPQAYRVATAGVH